MATSKQRKYLTPSEFRILYDSLKKIFTSTLTRNRAMILLMYRHGLRVSETITLNWSDLSFTDQSLLIRRLKNGKISTHPVQTDELHALNRLRNECIKLNKLGVSIFVNHTTGLPLTRSAVTSIFEAINKHNLLPTRISPHTLRHSCGYYLANKGYDTRLIQDYLGHRNIQNTEIYTELASNRFDSIKW